MIALAATTSRALVALKQQPADALPLTIASELQYKHTTKLLSNAVEQNVIILLVFQVSFIPCSLEPVHSGTFLTFS